MILELKCTIRHDYNPIVSRMKWCSSGYTARWSQNTGKKERRQTGGKGRKKKKNEGRGKKNKGRNL